MAHTMRMASTHTCHCVAVGVLLFCELFILIYNMQLPCIHLVYTLHCARRGLDKNIVSTTAPERAVLSVMSLGVALRTDESGASEAAETFIFLASI